MSNKIEITAIAIPLKNYNQHIAELVEHLLTLEGKLNTKASEVI